MCVCVYGTFGQKLARRDFPGSVGRVDVGVQAGPRIEDVRAGTAAQVGGNLRSDRNRCAGRGIPSVA